MQIERPDDVPLGMPSSEALQAATAAIRRHYVWPETIEHPEVRSECLWLAYLIQAYGLAAMQPEPTIEMPKTPRFSTASQYASPIVTTGRPQRPVAQSSRAPEPADA